MLQLRYEVNIGFDGKSIMRYYPIHKRISFLQISFVFGHSECVLDIQRPLLHRFI